MSILSVDFGSVNTRAVLLDLVDGTYQLIARAETRTTDGFPVGDVTVGLDRVLRELSDITGRVFTGMDGKIVLPEQIDRSGVDHFTATASLGRPLRAVIAGLVPDVSTTSALRAAAGTYVDVVAQIHLDDGRSEEEKVNTILLNYPDVILIAGGTEAGAEHAMKQLLSVVQIAVAVTPEIRRPTVIYAGNSALHDEVIAMLDGLAKVLLADNVRPSINHEKLDSAQARLGQAFDLYKEERSADFSTIAEMSQVGVRPTAQSYGVISEYYAKTRRDQHIVLVDVGSAASVLAAAIDGASSTAIRTDLGVGHNVLNLLNSVTLAGIRAWLPFNATNNELLNYGANKTLRPATVPATLRDIYYEHAMLRAAIHALLTAARPTWKDPQANQFDLLVGAGATLCNVGHPAYTALLLLDTVQPYGVTRIVADPFGLIPALGTVAAKNPQAVVQMLEGDNFEPLTTAFSLSGIPRLDKPAFKVKITVANGDEIEATINGGHLWVCALPVGQTAEVWVQVVQRGLAINGKRRLRVQVEGSAAGLMFDARGRPLVLDQDLRVRSTQMPLWVSEVTGDKVLEIDPRWLYDLEPEHIEAARKAERTNTRRQGGLRLPFFGGRRQRRDETPIDLPDNALLFDDEKQDQDDELKALRDASLP